MRISDWSSDVFSSDLAGVLEAIMIGPLPMIFELRLIARFVIGRIHIMYARLEAGFHDGKILIGQGQIDDELWLYPFDQRSRRGHVICINFRSFDGDACSLLDGFRNGIALGDRKSVV